MAITLYTQSKKDVAPIYIRVRQGDIDAKARTQFLINPELLSKSKVKLHRVPNGANAEMKQSIKSQNKPLIELQVKFDKLTTLVTNQINDKKDYEVIDSNWLKNLVAPKSEQIPTELTKYFDYFLEDKKTSLRHSTVKKLGSIKNRIEKYNKDKKVSLNISDVNNSFKSSISKWFDAQGYAHNTKVKTIKVIYTVCQHAKENGIKLHPEAESLTKKLKYVSTPHVYLTFKDLEKIENVELSNKDLEIARDWLIISCNTAQRVSDFMKFSKDNIVEMGDSRFLDIKQEKTDSPVYIPLVDTVVKVLEKYDNNFPPLFSTSVESNSAIYNRLIKQVCKKAEINETVTANLRQTKKSRYEIKEVPKWKAVSSHVGRRSFSTNYYGKINTALLISATGHASEKQFLTYVGKPQEDRAMALARALKQVALEQNQEPQLKVIKNVSNG
ncbi:site-specific integrase [Psychroserpens burtonensis]|uniref:Site-specific integrase n=1 Tax=Psychroserpens burtonensis TaxID=49278 RepID=A0A5C7B8G6_9FLAO|nr:phage integrase SAM-like domain-containing protein [Psychroserpens burtonensis]TXE18576.1 site-specific integrase [Psychroserpens burtonensis]